MNLILNLCDYLKMIGCDSFAKFIWPGSDIIDWIQNGLYSKTNL